MLKLAVSLFVLLSATVCAQHKYRTLVCNSRDSSLVSEMNVVLLKSGHIFASEKKYPYAITIPSTGDTTFMSIQQIGFESDTIALYTKGTKTDTIYVRPKAYNIGEITITAMSAKSVMKKALHMIDKVYNKNSKSKHFFYRQYHYENGKDVRTIECNVEVLFPTGEELKQTNNMVLLRTSDIFKSKVTEQNKDEHGDHLADILNEVPTLNRLGTVCNARGVRSCHFLLDDTHETSECFSIVYQFLSKEHIIHSGRIKIQKSDFAIIKIDEQTYPTQQYYQALTNAVAHPYRWELVSSRAIYNYEPTSAGYDLESCYKTYTHSLISTITQTKEFTVTENFELHPPAMPVKESDIEHKPFSVFGNLYTAKGGILIEMAKAYPCFFCQ